MTACQPLPDLARVARSFGKAASSYDRYARLQRDIADNLVTAVDLPTAQTILDLGSGTGYCAQRLLTRYPESFIVQLDIAQAMLDYARGSNSNSDSRRQGWVCSDAQRLPFRDDSIDLAVSSLTLQWCPHPERFFSELYRVMRPGARAWVSTLAEQTLVELRSSWASVDEYVHVNSFLTTDAITAAVKTSPFSHQSISNRQAYYYYDSLGTLMRELKGIGANNLNTGQSFGLTGKRKLQQLKSVFEKNRIAGKGIPVTYDLVLIRLEKV